MARGHFQRLTNCPMNCREVQEHYNCGCIYTVYRPCQHPHHPQQYPVPRGHEHGCGGKSNRCIGAICLYRGAWLQDALRTRDETHERFRTFERRAADRFLHRRVNIDNELGVLKRRCDEADQEVKNQMRALHYWLKDPRRVLIRIGALPETMDRLHERFRYSVQARDPLTWASTGDPFEKNYQPPPSPTDMYSVPGHAPAVEAEPVPLVETAVIPNVGVAFHNLFGINDNDVFNQGQHNHALTDTPPDQTSQIHYTPPQDGNVQYGLGNMQMVAPNDGFLQQVQHNHALLDTPSDQTGQIHYTPPQDGNVQYGLGNMQVVAPNGLLLQQVQHNHALADIPSDQNGQPQYAPPEDENVQYGLGNMQMTTPNDFGPEQGHAAPPQANDEVEQDLYQALRTDEDAQHAQQERDASLLFDYQPTGLEMMNFSPPTPTPEGQDNADNQPDNAHEYLPYPEDPRYVMIERFSSP